jgi:imidazolonepropionase-like amidohydrolase
VVRKLLFCLFAAVLFQPGAKAEPLAIVGARIVDVERGRIGPPSTVVIEGDAIVAIGPAGQVRVPREARRVDGRGRFLIPGLWDMGSFVLDGRRAGAPGAFELMIAYGVTGTRDLGTAMPAAEIAALDRAVAAGEVVGPRLIWTGATLSHTLGGRAVSGASSSRTPIDTAEDVSAAIARASDAGADYVNVVQAFPESLLPAAIAEARRHRLALTGAIVSSWGDAALAGLSGFEHFVDLYRSTARRPERDDFLRLYRDAAFQDRVAGDRGGMYAFFAPLRRLRDQPYYRQTIATMARARTPVTTNMATHYWAKVRFAALIDERRRFARPEPPQPAPTTLAQDVEASIGLRADLRDLRDAGVAVMAGTQAEDTSASLPGATLQDELVLLAEGGFTPREALAAATLVPARQIARLFPRVRAAGVVAVRSPADLVLLRGNPLQDIVNVRTIEGVVARGRWFGPEERAALLERAAALAAAGGEFHSAAGR